MKLSLDSSNAGGKFSGGFVSNLLWFGGELWNDELPYRFSVQEYLKKLQKLKDHFSQILT